MVVRRSRERVRRRASATLLAALATVAAGPVAHAGAAKAASPPPERDRIAFANELMTTGQQVFVISPDRTHRRRLTAPPPGASQPVWSPHGTRILYLRWPANGVGGPDLMVMGAAGRNKQRLVSGRYGVNDMAWAPAGRRIAFTAEVSTPGGGWFQDVYVYSMQTGELSRLHVGTPARYASTLDWSRDGRFIVFDAVRFTGPGAGEFEENADLYRVRPNGTGLRQLTNTPSLSEYSPRWSPDGTRMAYTRSSSACFESVVIGAADATSPRRVPLGCGASAADWSPNGRLLVYQLERNDSAPLVVTRLDGTHRRTLAQGLFPSWRPAR